MKKTIVTKSAGSSLSSRALLVHLNISQWTGRRTDKKATATVTKTHKTSLEAGSYTKRLLPGATELEAVATCATQIRKYVYEQTLPWLSDGSRIINAKTHLKFAGEIRQMKGDYEKAVKDFVNVYPRLQSEAQKKLGSLYSAAEYPPTSEIKNKFRCEVDYLPMPDEKDFRVELSDAEKKSFTSKMKQVEAEAMKEVWTRLHDVTQKAAAVLSKPGAIFRDSLLENVGEMLDLLPSLNISEDAKLEEAREDIKKLLGGYSADSLRADKDVRKEAAKKLKDVTDKMGAFMGAGA